MVMLWRLAADRPVLDLAETDPDGSHGAVLLHPGGCLSEGRLPRLAFPLLLSSCVVRVRR
jgi:hypothetical protein